MVFETFEDECFITCCFFLDDLHEVLVDLIIVDSSQGTQFLLLALALHKRIGTSSWVESSPLVSLRSTRPLRSRLSFLSSILSNNYSSKSIFGS